MLTCYDHVYICSNLKYNQSYSICVIMSDILNIIKLNAVCEDDLEAISDFFCGSDHVICKHVYCPLTRSGSSSL